MEKNGYDRYLDFQFGMNGPFFKSLFVAIGKADENNIEKLRKGFPEEVDGYLLFTRAGKDSFLEKCTPGNPLIERMRQE